MESRIAATFFELAAPIGDRRMGGHHEGLSKMKKGITQRETLSHRGAQRIGGHALTVSRNLNKIRVGKIVRAEVISDQAASVVTASSKCRNLSAKSVLRYGLRIR
jgi:hypothetical protein